jgi:hypothetical protein
MGFENWGMKFAGREDVFPKVKEERNYNKEGSRPGSLKGLVVQRRSVGKCGFEAG